MKNPHAVALGKKGGKAGTGAAKARTSEQARAAVLARWARRKPKRVARRQNMQIIAELDPTAALALHSDAGHEYPDIPPGENSAIEGFVTTDGVPALIINHRQWSGPVAFLSPDPAAVADPERAISEMLEFLDRIRQS